MTPGTWPQAPGQASLRRRSREVSSRSWISSTRRCSVAFWERRRAESRRAAPVSSTKAASRAGELLYSPHRFGIGPELQRTASIRCAAVSRHARLLSAIVHRDWSLWEGSDVTPGGACLARIPGRCTGDTAAAVAIIRSLCSSRGSPLSQRKGIRRPGFRGGDDAARLSGDIPAGTHVGLVDGRLGPSAWGGAVFVVAGAAAAPDWVFGSSGEPPGMGLMRPRGLARGMADRVC
jgi:hypothetical protein